MAIRPAVHALSLSRRELAAALIDPVHRETLSVTHGPGIVVVHDGAAPELDRGAAELLATVPAVLIGVASERAEAASLAPWCDVVLGSGDAALDRTAVPCPDPAAAARTLADRLAPRRVEAASLALLLRGSGRRSISDGLVAESLLYSLLLAGPGFAAWRAGFAVERLAVADREAPVVVQRRDDELTIALNRPRAHNAVNAALRDALAEALALASADPTIARVTLRGEGPSFCSGGDLREFGTAGDPVVAHALRLTRSLPSLLAGIASRAHVHVHGATIGAGIELAAFAARVTADEDTQIRLPELELGLIPGSGGTVSLPQRIGRWRTAWLALGGETIDAGAALRWGLVDALVGPD